MPAAARLRTEPGTAITSTDRSMAAWAVISDPPRSRLSTTTSTSLSAAMMRLRIGNRNGSGAVPGGHSDSSRPRPHDLRPTAPALTRGYGTSGPLPTTADRPPAGDVQHAPVGGAVDALGQPGHDGHAGLGQAPPELGGHLPARRRWRCGCRRCRPAGRRASPGRRGRTARPAAAGRGAARRDTPDRARVTTRDADRPGSARPTPPGAPALGRRPPRRAHRRACSRSRRRPATGGARPAATANASAGSWWASSDAQAGDGHQVEAGERGRGRRRTRRRSRRPSRHQPVRRAAQRGPACDRATSTCSTSTSSRPCRPGRRAGRRWCGRPGGCGGSRAR